MTANNALHTDAPGLSCPLQSKGRASAVRDNFEPAEILDSMRQVITVRKVAAEESMGQVFEMYRITDGATDLGILSLTYGTASSIRGTGTVSYLSADRARAEGIGVK